MTVVMLTYHREQFSWRKYVPHVSYALHVYEQIQLSRFCHIMHGTKLALRFSPRARLLRILLVRLLWRLDRTEPHRN